MANHEHLAILVRGVEAWNRWRDDNPTIRPDLSQADLSGVSLREVNLSVSDLSGVNLRNADLRYANLCEADLTKTPGRWSNPRHQVRHGLISQLATLSGADLRDSFLIGTQFFETTLDHVNLESSTMGNTSFNRVDLSTVKGLAYVEHPFASSFATDTLIRTLRSNGGKFTDEQNAFFERGGVPSILLDYLPGIIETNPIQFYSCFISYSVGDEEFATKLNENLKTAGVTTWKWNLDAVPGRYIRNNIDEALRNFDKLILVLSANSLASRGVELEIRRALQKEERLRAVHEERTREALAEGSVSPQIDSNVLVPIRLDDSIFNWISPLAPDLTQYYIPDFSDAQSNSRKYRRELSKLIRVLSPSDWAEKAQT